jgi:division protein CdvB (Snf7/Vps24/ESCRT-III family)
MTSIAGVSTSSSSTLIQMLQEAIRKRTEAASDVAATQSAQIASTGQAEFESQFKDALVAAGLDSSRLDELKSDVQSAVSAALSQSDGTADPRQTVGDAIKQVLQSYGVDTDKLKTQMKSAMGSRPAGPPPGGRGPGGKEGFDSKVTDALTAVGVDASKLDEVKSAIDSAIASMTQDSEEGADSRDAIKETVNKVLDQYGIDKDAFDQQMRAGMGEPPQGPPPGGQGANGTSDESQAGGLLSYLGNSNSSTDSSWLAGLFQIIDEQA